MRKKEKEHLSKIVSLGCVVCRNLGYGETPASAHHINCKTMGKRSSHFKTIPLCPTHHQTGGYGVAVHAGLEEWERRYGTEQDLLAQTLSEM